MHKSYLAIAKAARQLSKDRSKIGAVALDYDSRIVGVGVNGYPPGYEDSDDTDKYDKVIHAEVNAVINSRTNRGEIHTIYVYGLPPCKDCLKFLAAYGVRWVIFSIDEEIESSQYWMDDHNRVKNIHKLNIVEVPYE